MGEPLLVGALGLVRRVEREAAEEERVARPGGQLRPVAAQHLAHDAGAKRGAAEEEREGGMRGGRAPRHGEHVRHILGAAGGRLDPSRLFNDKEFINL